ncbi:Chaperone of endosialidase [Roseovarius lutimaris]|uniref:Chaperone of endosialidase n=1 Tax=Roseovarius lutimaris TaxID=1005928 RepID=A0A1I5GDV7_9RHOB|nr:DUF2793 domain-containing protein [Roseovarius lutimaris]SFO34154.1 Chaperone of endosialidase [Roseovarius lutimaris]
MSDLSARLALPFIAPSQAQKHVTHNEALQQLDLLVQMRVEGVGVTAPPVAPDPGALYALGAGAQGDWAGQDGQLAAFLNESWLFFSPQEGWQAIDLSTGGTWIYRGGSWQNALDQLESVGIGTTADAVNRLAVAAEATLLSHEGAGHQLKINKATLPDTASLLFQTGWSGRAEMGLTGSDDFAIKTSSDGVGWSLAATFAADTGAVGFGDGQPPQYGGHLRIADPNLGNARLELQAGDAGPDSYAMIEHASAGGDSSQMIFSVNAATNALIDFNPVDDGSSGAAVRFFRSTNSTGLATLTLHQADGSSGWEHRIAGNSDTTLSLSHDLGVGTTNPNAKLTVQGNVTPGTDNAFNLGSATHRWSSIWAVNGTIQTSDERDKHVENRIDPALATDLIRQVDPVFFKWKAGGNELCDIPGDDPVPLNTDQIAAARADPIEPHEIAPVYLHTHKGKRTHAGFLAQDVKRAMDAAGIDFGAWGIENLDATDSRQFLRPDQLIPVLWAAVRYLLEQQKA